MSNETFFNDDWIALQRKYWDNWTEMSRKAMGMEGAANLTSPLGGRARSLVAGAVPCGPGGIQGIHGQDDGSGQGILPHGGDLWLAHRR